MGNAVDCHEPIENDTAINVSSGDNHYYYYYYGYYVGVETPRIYAAVLYIVQEILPLIITAASLVGNILIILTMTMKKNRSFSTGAFFISLALSDLVTTISEPFTDWLMNRLETVDMDISCKLTAVFTHVPMYISSLTLAVITSERTISVSLPHKVKVICTKTTAKLILIMLWISCLSFGIFVSFNVGSYYSGKGFILCDVTSPTFESFFIFVYPWIHSALGFFIPASVIVTGTIIIIYKLYIRPNISHTPRSLGLRTLSFTLINTNIVFILTKLPWAVFSLRLSIIYLQGKCFSNDFILENFLTTLFIFFDELNLVLNFFIYFLSGSKFRNDVKTLMLQMLKKCHNCVVRLR